MRGENFITARVVFELCEREPLFMGGAFFFVVESGVAGEGDGGPQSKNRFDACAFWVPEGEASKSESESEDESESESESGSESESVYDPAFAKYTTPMRWNAFQKEISLTQNGKQLLGKRVYQGEAYLFWKVKLDQAGHSKPRNPPKPVIPPKLKPKGPDTAIPDELPARWLKTRAEAKQRGGRLVLLFEGKWLTNWDVESVKMQAVSYTCVIGRSIAASEQDKVERAAEQDKGKRAADKAKRAADKVKRAEDKAKRRADKAKRAAEKASKAAGNKCGTQIESRHTTGAARGAVPRMLQPRCRSMRAHTTTLVDGRAGR